MRRLQELLKERRKELGLSQKDVHRMCEWGKKPEYWLIEREKLPATNAQFHTIGQILDIDLSDYYSTPHEVEMNEAPTSHAVVRKGTQEVVYDSHA